MLNLINNDHFENVDALDSEITENDIIKAIAKLKPEKSAGSDNIIGEIFTASPIFFAPLLKKLFNYIFNHGIYPDLWTECLVIPVPKSGDLSDPNNYSPIVLVSVLSKLFTSILTERLLSCPKMKINQFGFRPGRSTVDAIFIILGIISNILQNKFKLYSAFVDFRKAFDKLNRRILIYKLLRNGLRLYHCYKFSTIYSSVRFRVEAGGVLSDAFDNLLGVKQGEPLSSLLFLFFINDIIDDISTDTAEMCTTMY